MSRAQSSLSSSDLAAFGQSDPNDVGPELLDLYLTGVKQDLVNLESLVAELEGDGRPWRQALTDMRLIVHNVKGQGTSFGYPMMTEIGDSLYKLVLAVREKPGMDTIKVIAAHVDSLRTIIDHGIRTGGGSLGQQVVARLKSLSGKAGF